MDLVTAVGLLAVVVLVIANGFFVATEFAIVAVRRSRLEQLAAEGNAAARGAKHIVDHLDAYIAACQLGITMASLALGWIGEPALSRLIEPSLERVLGRVAPAAAHGVAIAVAFAVITALHIVAGELAPKGFALQRPEKTALWVARPMQLFYVLFRWPITLLNAVGNGVLSVVGLRPAAGHEMVHSVEELDLLVRASQRAGTIEASEARIASRAFQFADLAAMQLMTPRIELEAVSAGIGLDDLLARVAATRHGRLLVYDGTLDNVLGAIRVRDLIPFTRSARDGFDLRVLIRPVLTVPESRKADDLLEDMRRAGRHLAVVVDEFGGTAGIVTLADLMRALVGPIEEESGLGPAGGPILEPDGSMLFDGLMRIHEFEELTGVDLEEEQRAAVATLSGLVMLLLDRLPRVGDEVEVAHRRLRVERIERHRVALVRLLAAAEVRGRSVGRCGHRAIHDVHLHEQLLPVRHRRRDGRERLVRLLDDFPGVVDDAPPPGRAHRGRKRDDLHCATSAFRRRPRHRLGSRRRSGRHPRRWSWTPRPEASGRPPPGR